MRPLLVSLESGDDRTITSIRGELAERFALSQADLDELIPSGRVTTFQNRVGWAVTYLYRTKLIARPKRAVYRITDRGRQVLEENPERVDLKVLGKFEELAEFRQAKAAPTDGGDAEPIPAEDEQTPEERIDRAYRELGSALAAELLDRVSEQSPEFFEQLVLDVLQAMGYGGRRDDAAERLGQSGDEGVDGVIREARLGLDLIYVQAKRWKNVVGRPEIQKSLEPSTGSAPQRACSSRRRISAGRPSNTPKVCYTARCPPRARAGSPARAGRRARRRAEADRKREEAHGLRHRKSAALLFLRPA